jgi:hypothetical protein
MAAVLTKRRSETNHADFPAAAICIRDQEWCIEVIKVAVIAAGYDFRKLTLSASNLHEELKRGKFLVDGIQVRVAQNFLLVLDGWTDGWMALMMTTLALCAARVRACVCVCLQNRQWLKGSDWLVNDPTDTGDGPETAAGRRRWRHSIAIVGGHVREQQGERFGIKWLWIGKDGHTADEKKGYMREIIKVFKITKRDDAKAAAEADAARRCSISGLAS